jgi:cyclopropane fatty-acyl-phospholipid synthase-like methyltransferase
VEYYENIQNAKDYIEMASGYDGRELIDLLRTFLPEGASVLELGLGPGKDLEYMDRFFDVLGTDKSQAFLDIFAEENPDIPTQVLDARTMKIQKKFDCIYSNKVLHHLSTQDLADSLKLQGKKLKEQGLLFHTFWLGDGEEHYEGLNFVYYRPKEIITMTEEDFNILSVQDYGEEEPGDSFYIILQKK